MQMQMIVKERLLEFRDYLGLNTQTLEAQRLAGGCKFYGRACPRRTCA